MNKKLINLPMAAGLLVAGVLALSAHSASALTVWDGTWGQWKAAGVAASCNPSLPITYTGSSAVNGNDANQVIAYCANNNTWSCGGISNQRRSVVRARGCAADGTDCVQTPDEGSTGTSVGSATRTRRAIANHRCQMGVKDTL